MTQGFAYTAFYSHEFRSQIALLKDLELRLFALLATYADEFGTCYPGIAELSKRSARSEKDVRSALDGLVQKRLIVRLDDAESDPQKRKALRGHYALSGKLLRIKQNQNQNQEPNPINQNQEPPSPTTTTSKTSSENWKNPAIASLYDPQEKIQNKAAEDASSVSNTTKPARSAASSEAVIRTPTPPLSPSPPELDQHNNLFRYREPLPEADDEALANEVYFVIHAMGIAVARQLVAKHGRDKVNTTLVHFRRQPMGSLHTPAGWFIDQLKKSALLLDKDGEQKNGAGYVGAYSDFVNS